MINQILQNASLFEKIDSMYLTMKMQVRLKNNYKEYESQLIDASRRKLLKAENVVSHL